MPGLLIDIRPLRTSVEFRRMWVSFLVCTIGNQLTIVAIAYEVYRLTNSSLDVGLISLVQLGPTLVGSLVGGSIADAIDRKKLLLVVVSGMIIGSAGLAANASLPHPGLLALYLLAAFNAAMQGTYGPAVVALLLSAIDNRNFVAANALRQTAQQFSLVAGPSVAGFLLAAFNVRLIFLVNIATSVVSLLLLLRISSHMPVGGTTRFGLKSIVEGFQFLRGRQPIQGCFVADLNATILGMPTSLFPALGIAHFHGGAQAVGFLYTAPGLGALIATMLSGWTSRIRRLGRAVCIAILIWGIAIGFAGVARSLVLALVLFAIAGGADVMSAVFRSTIIQTEVPDRLRGRLSSIQQAVVNSGPRLGNAEAGIVAALSSVQTSIISGGFGCIFGIAIVARLMPRFYHYQLVPHEQIIEPDAIAEPAGES